MTKPLVGIELAKEIEKIRQQMPLHIQAQAVQAKMYYEYFNILVKEGFTEMQALEIIKSRGLN